MDPLREDGRRCIDAEEMVALGWERSAQGRWFDPVRHPGARLRGRPDRTAASVRRLVAAETAL